MSDTLTDETAADEAHHGPTDATFFKTALVLALLTAIEVWLSYSGLSSRVFVPLLLLVMVVKFFIVVLVFMHIKYDAKIFGRLFYMGLFLAVGVYVAALMTFHFFNA